MNDDERARRIGQNEALYRLANERIKDLNENLSTISGVFMAVCECGDLTCNQQIDVSPSVYEQVRTNPHWFIMAPGHEAEDVERVIEAHEAFHVVEKLPGSAAELAEETDPRHP